MGAYSGPGFSVFIGMYQDLRADVSIDPMRYCFKRNKRTNFRAFYIENIRFNITVINGNWSRYKSL